MKPYHVDAPELIALFAERPTFYTLTEKTGAMSRKVLMIWADQLGRVRDVTPQVARLCGLRLRPDGWLILKGTGHATHTTMHEALSAKLGRATEVSAL